ncbi:MAG: BTAD domain-containing putative transcriptional regulator [Solirubrobacterales bacterium]
MSAPLEPRGGRAATAAAKGRRPRARGLFDRFPEGLVLVGDGRSVVSVNRKAHELLGLEGPVTEDPPPTCCELVCDALVGDGESRRCLAERILGEAEGSPEIRAWARPAATGATVSVIASRLDAEDVRVLLQVERSDAEGAGDEPSSAAGGQGLRIQTLGRVAVEVAGRDHGGEWIEQRPGLLLKYLVCERHRVAASDRIAEALWPEAGRREGLTTLRHYVHVLRERLEPDRPKRGASSFIETHRGGYRLDPARVWVDATELERRVAHGLRLHEEGQPEAAAPILTSAAKLHRGEFLADDPQAEWALEERERLHGLVARACEALIDAALSAGDLGSATESARRLADLEPLDAGVQRQLIELWLRQGRRSDAARRYELLRTRTLREFGEEPDFSLSDLTA